MEPERGERGSHGWQFAATASRRSTIARSLSPEVGTEQRIASALERAQAAGPQAQGPQGARRLSQGRTTRQSERRRWNRPWLAGAMDAEGAPRNGHQSGQVDLPFLALRPHGGRPGSTQGSGLLVGFPTAERGVGRRLKLEGCFSAGKGLDSEVKPKTWVKIHATRPNGGTPGQPPTMGQLACSGKRLSLDTVPPPAPHTSL
jgi:hypothetical protein